MVRSTSRSAPLVRALGPEMRHARFGRLREHANAERDERLEQGAEERAITRNGRRAFPTQESAGVDPGEADGQRGVGEVVLGGERQPGEMVRGRCPRRERVEDPQPLESVAVGDGRRLGRFGGLAGGGSVADLLVARGRRSRCRVRLEPPPQRLWAADLRPELGEDDIEWLGDAPLDVLLTHDAPAGMEPKIGSFEVLPPRTAEAAWRTRWFVLTAMRATHPRLVLHGHWHVRQSRQETDHDGSEYRVEGLASDQEANPSAWGVLELPSLVFKGGDEISRKFNRPRR